MKHNFTLLIFYRRINNTWDIKSLRYQCLFKNYLAYGLIVVVVISFKSLIAYRAAIESENNQVDSKESSLVSLCCKIYKLMRMI